MKGWDELIKTVHHAFEYGLHSSDMALSEVEEDISVALDRFATDNGLPVHDWDVEYEEQYGNEETE